MNGYNGWSNRETWLVNLHWGDNSDEYVGWYKDVDELAEGIKNMVYEYVEEQAKDTFISDMINLNSIDWQELAEAWADGAYDEEELEEETE